jgi:membrane peptidoglycan carboxypeptidase
MIWRRIRRGIYIALGVMFLGPILAFAIGWLIFSVPSPDDSAVNQVATISFADGTELAKIVPKGNVNRVKVSLDEVPAHVQHAVLAAEDRSFYTHPGFDIGGIGRAVWNQLSGGSGGGSTITQQYIKVTSGQDQATLWRKYKEIVVAAKISKNQTKEQILENYLNTVYFGRGAYGVQAASQAYYGKNVNQLSPAEGAMLAGLIQSPARWDPKKDAVGAQQRWGFVLDGMVSQNWLSPVDRAAAKFPATIDEKPAVGLPEGPRGHIYTQIKDELAAKKISETQLNQDGLKITTTIDKKAQQQAEDAVAAVFKGQPANLRSALVAIDPKTGAILAYYGGSDGVGFDYAQTLKQPGSAFKPFVLAAALQQNPPIGLGATYDGSSPRVIKGQKVSNSDGYNCDNCDLKRAMKESINTIFYQLGTDVGPDRVAEAAHEAGIPADLLPDPTGGLALGDKEVRPVDMASAFATFAADGQYHAPHMITKVETADGRVLYSGGEEVGEPRVPQQVARNITESLLEVANFSGLPVGSASEVASKTGTVQHALPGQNQDAWMVGYTPQVSVSVWVGTDQNEPIKSSSGQPIFGRMLPGQTWQKFMNSFMRDKKKEAFSPFFPLGTPPAQPAPTTAQNDNGDQNPNGPGQQPCNLFFCPNGGNPNGGGAPPNGGGAPNGNPNGIPQGMPPDGRATVPAASPP